MSRSDSGAKPPARRSLGDARLSMLATPRQLTTRAEFAADIRREWSNALEATIAVGRRLNEAKAALPHGEYEAMVATDLPFSTSTARKLREIAAFVDEGQVPLDRLPEAMSPLNAIATLKTGQPSTLLRKLNVGDAAGAAAEFAKWTRGAGKVMPGLVKRRAAEAALFLSDEAHPVSRVAELAPAMKPMVKSASAVSGGGALGLAGVAILLDQARDVSTAIKGLLESLPSGAMGWAVASLLGLAVTVMLYRRWDDQRKAA